MNENQIRDIIAGNMSILESGLSLLKKEQYIPGDIGTRSFIDLYARDVDGHHVIIEIKRSNAAAREAIHEIYKYVESVKRHLAARDDEIRVFIVSTEWKELIIPFSNFVSDTSLSVTGLNLKSCVDGGDFKSSVVSPLVITEGRFIAPWHELSTYVSKESFERGLLENQESCSRQGIEDYVIVVLKPHVNFNANARKQMIDYLGSDQGIDDYEFMIYLAYNQLTREQCLKALSVDKEALDQALSLANDENEQNNLFWLHNAVRDLPPYPHSDYAEIGTPAKFRGKILRDEKWEIVSVEKYGAFNRNNLLTDEDIISELCGSAGSSKQKFERQIQISNKAHVSSAKNDIEFCLQDNPIWKKHLFLIIDECSKDFPNASAHVDIFNPCTGLLTLYLYSRGSGDLTYIPSFSIAVFNDGDKVPVRFYCGMLLPDENQGDLDDILMTHYEGDIAKVVMSLSWGGYTNKDTDILEDAGFTYKTFKVETSGRSRSYYAYKNDRWRSSAAIRPQDMFVENVSTRKVLCDELVARISPMDFGAFTIIDHAGKSS